VSLRLKPGDWPGGFDLATKRKRIVELEGAMSAPDFWQNRTEADRAIKELGEAQSLLTRYDAIDAALTELAKDFSDEKFYDTKRLFRELELETLFTGLYDREDAVVGIFPGAGGDDAEDWARMLFEMYEKYAASRGWKTALLDDNPHRRTMEVRGKHAYGYLKGESGVHRLVRMSPFSAKQLRHTSFTLVEVLPVLPKLEEEKIEIPEQDLKFEFFRSSGPGGQNVNKVETAVRIIHVPTGLVATSQVERSQASNRERALKLLKARIFQAMEGQQIKEIKDLRAKIKPEWGNQIRSYVLNPYQLVKDHRTEVETSNVDAVLGGALDKFIEAEVELEKR
jgi:peptide chain release factor 2